MGGQVQNQVFDGSGWVALKGDSTGLSPAKPATGTQTSVAGSGSSGTLLAANTSRKSASIYNDSTAILYVKFGATASTSSYKVQLGPNEYFEFPQPCYTGIVDGIWASATGNARISEES
jgi:hypothetical protein